MGMIRTPVVKLAKKLIADGAIRSVDEGDLVDAALAEVWRARERFDPSRSSFLTFAMYRARGAMIDELRELDHVPRLERARAKKEGRELRKMETGSHTPHVFDGEDRRSLGPLEEAHGRDLWREIRKIVGQKYATVLELYYRRDRTLKEIGQELGYSESRVCQLHGKAVALLRQRWRRGETA